MGAMTIRFNVLLKILIPLALVIAVALAMWGALITRYGGVSVEVEEMVAKGRTYYLPLPKFTSGVMVEEAIAWRRSLRDFTKDPISIWKLSMILWAAQGITEFRYGFRASPSAGATYPLEVYVVVGERGVKVNETAYLPPGSYKYDCKRHTLTLVKEGDLRSELAKAALDQEWVRSAPVDIVICAVYERTTSVYGERGYRYVYMEVGHVGQNIYLMATALNLGTVAVGAFYDDWVKNVVGAREGENPLYIMPVGVPVKPYRVSAEDIASYYRRARSVG